MILSIGAHFRGANTPSRFKAVGKFEFLDQTLAHWTQRGLCYHLQSLTNTGVWFHHRWNNVCRQLGTDVLHLIPAERRPVWTFEAHRTHKQTHIERNSFTQSTFLLFRSHSKVRMKKRHNALFPRWLSGWSWVWLNTCCVAQWLLNEARTDIPPAGRSGTYSNCEPPAEDEDNEQQWKYLCCNNWQHLKPPSWPGTKPLRLFVLLAENVLLHPAFSRFTQDWTVWLSVCALGVLSPGCPHSSVSSQLVLTRCNQRQRAGYVKKKKRIVITDAFSFMTAQRCAWLQN